MSVTLTVRELAIQALTQTMQAMKEGIPVADPYSFTWDEVNNNRLSKEYDRRTAALGVYDLSETKVLLTSIQRCTLKVMLEIKLFLDQDDDASYMLNLAFGDIERKLNEDITLGGKVIQVLVVSNESLIDDLYSREVTGIMHLELLYRHAQRDPRLLV